MEIKITMHLITRSFTRLALSCALALMIASPVPAAENWKVAFEEICSQVDVSQTLSTKEIAALIERADWQGPSSGKRPASRCGKP